MFDVEILEVNQPTAEFLTDLRDLLSRAFGGRFSNEDWDHTLGGTHIAVRESGVLVSHAAVVPRRLHIAKEIYSCGYVEAVATLPTYQRKGLAGIAILEANKIIKENFQVGALSSSSKGFYRNLKWEDWRGPSYVLVKGEWIRSEPEDEGIMILRTEATSSIDLTSRIGCEERSGDSW